jgi:hypothetical protein
MVNGMRFRLYALLRLTAPGAGEHSGFGVREANGLHFWVRLASVWVRFGLVFFTIVNKDGQSLASFFEKNISRESRRKKSEAGSGGREADEGSTG